LQIEQVKWSDKIRSKENRRRLTAFGKHRISIAGKAPDDKKTPTPSPNKITRSKPETGCRRKPDTTSPPVCGQIRQKGTTTDTTSTPFRIAGSTPTSLPGSPVPGGTRIESPCNGRLPEVKDRHPTTCRSKPPGKTRSFHKNSPSYKRKRIKCEEKSLVVKLSLCECSLFHGFFITFASDFIFTTNHFLKDFRSPECSGPAALSKNK